MTIEPHDSSSLRLEELYRPPAVEGASAPSSLANPAFYVVSPRKFLVLFFATFGGYQLYWFFANWRRYRDRARSSLFPFWRAVFSPLFAHQLFRIIADPIIADPIIANQETPSAPASPRFRASAMATLYVVLVVGTWLLDRVDESRLNDAVCTVLGLCTAYPLLAAQNAANAAAGDPAGSSNSRLTGLNYLFIVVGVLIWPLFVLGISTE